RSCIWAASSRPPRSTTFSTRPSIPIPRPCCAPFPAPGSIRAGACPPFPAWYPIRSASRRAAPSIRAAAMPWPGSARCGCRPKSASARRCRAATLPISSSRSPPMSDLPATSLSLPDDVLFSVRGLKKYFPIHEGWLKKHVGDVKAIDDVSLDIRKGETLGLVGESGSGKSTVARLMLRAYSLTDGQILFRRANGEIVDLSGLTDRQMRPLRAEMQMIFQDPYSSLNPRMTLLELVGEPMLIHGKGNDGEIRDRVAELLRVVGLRPEFIN